MPCATPRAVSRLSHTCTRRYQWRQKTQTQWQLLQDAQIWFTDVLYLLVILGVCYFGAGVLRVGSPVH